MIGYKIVPYLFESKIFSYLIGPPRSKTSRTILEIKLLDPSKSFISVPKILHSLCQSDLIQRFVKNEIIKLSRVKRRNPVS